MEQVHWKDLQAHMTHTCEALINCTQNICFNNLVHRAAMCENADIKPLIISADVVVTWWMI